MKSDMMDYDYQTERPHLFTDEGQRMLLKMRDEALKLIDEAGAVIAYRVMDVIDYRLFHSNSKEEKDMLACMDRMVELGDLVEIPNPQNRTGNGRYRLFMRNDD